MGAIRALIGEVEAGRQVLDLVLAFTGYLDRSLLHGEGTLLFDRLVGVGGFNYHVCLFTAFFPLCLSHRLRDGEGVRGRGRGIILGAVPANRVLHFGGGQFVYRNEVTLAVNSAEFFNLNLAADWQAPGRVGSTSCNGFLYFVGVGAVHIGQFELVGLDIQSLVSAALNFFLQGEPAELLAVIVGRQNFSFSCGFVQLNGEF